MFITRLHCEFYLAKLAVHLTDSWS